MVQSLFRRGAQALFSRNCAAAALGPRAVLTRYRPTATTTKLFTGFKPSGAQPRYGARRHMHHQPRAPPPPPPPTEDPSVLQRRLVIWPFIGANVLVFFWWQQAQAEARGETRGRSAGAGVGAGPSTGRLAHMIQNYTVSLQNIREGRWRTLLTCAASHATLDHLLFNMISFHAFAGFALMSGLPVPTLLALGVGSALASDLASLYHWDRKGQQNHRGLGASGVISGMSTALACLHPQAPFQLMFIPIGIPLWVLVVGYIAYDSYRLDSQESTIGHSAHLGGSAFGFLFYALFLRKYGGVLSMFRRR